MASSRIIHDDAELRRFKATLTPEEQELLPGYLEMAADEEREAEAQEWIEGLIGDGFPKG